MFAAHIVEPAHMGIPERHKVVLCEKRSERDRLVKHVNDEAEAWREYRRRNPHGMVPPCFKWYPGTTAEPLTMRDARRLIEEDDPIFEHDGWSYDYAYIPCTIYEFSILPYGVRYGWKDGRHYRSDEMAA